MEDAQVTGALVGASEIEIAAPVDVVWDVLTDLDRWPSWNPEVKSMTTDGDLAVGSVFRWKAGPGRLTSTIERLDPPRVVAWTGKTMGIRAEHVWQLAPRDGGTFVRTDESFDGLPARLLRRTVQRALDTGLDNGLRYLKSEAERRAAA